MTELSVLWQNQTKVSVDQKAVERHLGNLLRRTGVVGMVEVELTLVGDRAITKLKQQFLGKNEPTDVLSFPAAAENIEKDNLIGSIVISVDTAKRQAQEAGVVLIDELKMLAGHGTLHLLGYHHK